MHENELLHERALLIGVDTGVEDTESLLAELAELSATAGIEVVATQYQKRFTVDSSTFVGSGFLEEVKSFCELNEVNLLVFDDELTTTQQKNIETITGIATIDRTMLILDIFAQRARSGEGRIQVELARCRYLLPRLIGQGVSLSRQGGAGHLRGSGESKLETDRRHIRRRITALERKIEEIDRRRGLLRSRRKKNRIPTVAIVGYTNAGKSTLMNLLTDAGVLSEDMLFATLDPTARALSLPSGQTVMLVDTVGLVRKLPHQLVEAFKSTLNEAAEADVILNLCDASSDERDEHLKVTEKILGELGFSGPVVTVMNKCDLLPENVIPFEGAGTVCISALNNIGIDKLLYEIERVIPNRQMKARLLLPYNLAGEVSRIRSCGTVEKEDYTEEGIVVECVADCEQLDRLKDYILPDQT